MDALLNRRPQTVWERFISSPLFFLAKLLYITQPQSLSEADKIQVVCISDTHNTHHSQPPLPDGDILIHSGDLTVSGTQSELDDVLGWLESQSHRYKFFIAGNHDAVLANNPDIHQYISAKYPTLTYLQDSSAQVVVRGRTLTVYGSPWTPHLGRWVFQYPAIHPPWYSISEKPTSEYQSTVVWSQIPPLTDILITHCPPFGHLDDNSSLNLEKAAGGCYALLAKLWMVRPKMHVFGHMHAGRGTEVVRWDRTQKAYEDILARRGGWTCLVRMAWYGAFSWFWGCNREEEDTLMVNAAAIGGNQESQKLGVIVVKI